MPHIGISNSGLKRLYGAGLTATVSGTAAQATAISAAKLETKDGWVSLANEKSAIFAPFGTDAENEIGNFQLQIAIPWGGKGSYTSADDDGSSVQKIILSVAYGTFTLGTRVGAGVDPQLTSSEYLADTIATTKTVAGTWIENMMGATIETYTPADNGIAMIGARDWGPARWVRLLPGLGGSATAASVNAAALLMT
ncbi:MAG: hypothetical protein RIB60_06030 [Phycisphaerales bacterium]